MCFRTDKLQRECARDKAIPLTVRQVGALRVQENLMLIRSRIRIVRKGAEYVLAG